MNSQRLARPSLYEMSSNSANELRHRLRSIQEKLAWNAILMTAGVIGSVQTGGFSLVASILAAKGVGESFLEYRREVKRHPAYFLWKLPQRKV